LLHHRRVIAFLRFVGALLRLGFCQQALIPQGLRADGSILDDFSTLRYILQNFALWRRFSPPSNLKPTPHRKAA
jgi:hypothetical protein